MVKLAIQKDAEMSIHDQLVTQLSMQIASGHVDAGTRLPSVRKLSRQLGIHYNTCLTAYRELETRGFIVIKRGSGATVADLKPDDLAGSPENGGLSQLARFFVQQVYQKGYAWNEVLRAVKEANRQYLGQASRVLVYADAQSEILPLFQAELTDALNMTVKTAVLDEFDPTVMPEDAVYLTSRYHIRALESRLEQAGCQPEEGVFVVDVASGQQEVEAIKALPEGELLVIVSQSTAILQQAEAVITALRGDEILCRMVHTSEGDDEIQKALRYGKLIFADYLAAPRLAEITRKPVHMLRVIPEAEMERVRTFLKEGV